MKRRLLAVIKVEKAKRVQKRVRHHPVSTAKDRKDLRGAKGALLKNAVDRALENEVTGAATVTSAPLPSESATIGDRAEP